MLLSVVLDRASFTDKARSLKPDACFRRDILRDETIFTVDLFVTPASEVKPDGIATTFVIKTKDWTAISHPTVIYRNTA